MGYHADSYANLAAAEGLSNGSEQSHNDWKANVDHAFLRCPNPYKELFAIGVGELGADP